MQHGKHDMEDRQYRFDPLLGFLTVKLFLDFFLSLLPSLHFIQPLLPP